MFASLRSRMFAGFVLVIAVVLLVSAVTLLVFAARSNLTVRAELRNTAARLLQRPELTLDRPGLHDELAERISENFGFRVLVVDAQGRVVADSSAGERVGFQTSLRIPRDPLREVFTIRDLDGQLWLYTGRRAASGYALVVMEPRRPVRDLLSSPITVELLRALGQSGLVALALSLILAFVLSRSVAAPLSQISEAARRLASGQKTVVQPAGPKEVRVLAESFNEMSAQVFASQQSQRDFVANVSHELKTPLTSVQGFAQAILDGTAGTPEARQQAAQVIYDESGRMHRLVLDLLDLARLDAGTADLRRERVELDVLLQAVIERLMPQSVRAGVALVDQIGSLPPVVGDGDRLSQVFNNLVENAIKHTPAGGKVSISTQTREGQAAVSIRDTGPGIPPEELPRIFERFYQMDKSRKHGPSHSAGLGLAIATQIVEAHGGQISAQSVVGEGSEFTVTLPPARPDDLTLEMRAVK